jgi:hypothetical protein
LGISKPHCTNDDKLESCDAQALTWSKYPPPICDTNHVSVETTSLNVVFWTWCHRRKGAEQAITISTIRLWL